MKHSEIIRKSLVDIFNAAQQSKADAIANLHEAMLMYNKAKKDLDEFEDAKAEADFQVDSLLSTLSKK